MTIEQKLGSSFRKASFLDLLPLIRAFGTVFSVYILCSTAVRAIMTVRTESVIYSDHIADIAVAFVLGFISDIAIGLVISSLLLLPFLFMRKMWTTSKKEWISAGLLLVIFWGVVFGAISELFFWEEFANRFNGIAVSYLIFPREVIGNLQESFNFAIWLPIISLLTILLWLPFIKAFNRGHKPNDLKGWKRRGLAVSMTAFLIGLVIVSALPVRPSDNREINEIAKNGLVSLVTAAIYNDEEYIGRYPSLNSATALKILRAEVAQDNTDFIDPTGENFPILRQVTNSGPEKRLNIVVILEESFGSNLVDTLDNKKDVKITPNLTELSKDGIWFTNLYASGDRTVRGLEAILTSFAPIPGISTARRSGSKNMFSIPHALEDKGYTTAMLYGGAKLFDNMGTFWEGIGFDNIWDQSDVRHDAFTTVWGVSDGDLFTEALLRLDENARTPQNQKKPFFLSMLTVSNHRPYKFPQTDVKWKKDRGRIENTATYADWAFGNFIKRAREKPWFADTVFVFVADHARKVNGSAQVPIHRFRIPALFYSPKHLKPETIDTLTAQIDVMPTLLGKLNFSYVSPFFGMDVADIAEGHERIIAAHNFSVAYGKIGGLAVLEPTGEVLNYDFIPGEKVSTTDTPTVQVAQEAISTVQTAHKMFYSGKYHSAKDQ